MPRTPPPLKNLRVAVSRLEAAYRDALLWSDLIRQDAEKRLNVGPTDQSVLDDPAYDATLRWCSALDGLHERANEVLADPPAASRG